MTNTRFLQPTSEFIQYSGRFDTSNPEIYSYSFSACSISICTNSNYIDFECADFILSDAGANFIEVYINDVSHSVFELSSSKQKIRIFTQANNNFCTVKVVKRTEALVGKIAFYGFTLSENSECKPIPSFNKKILAIGDSITCGYGNESTNVEEEFTSKNENAYLSSTAICARKLQADYHVVAYSGKGIYRNYDEKPGQQDTIPIIFDRIHPLEKTSIWEHALYIPDCILINLGTNDFSPPFGIQKNEYIGAYSNFINTLCKLYPASKIVIINSQMLEGNERTMQISWLKEIVKAFENVLFCEISQQGMLGYGGDWHPNIVQNKLNAAEIYRYIVSQEIM